VTLQRAEERKRFRARELNRGTVAELSGAAVRVNEDSGAVVASVRGHCNVKRTAVAPSGLGANATVAVGTGADDGVLVRGGNVLT